MTKYQQWQSQEKRAEKVTITASVNDIFEDLRDNLSSFLIHRYIKRKQQDQFTQLIKECGGSLILLQFDFSENAVIIHPNGIQSAQWSHQKVTVFTAQAWIDQDEKESFSIILNNLDHIKEAVFTFLSLRN